MQGRSRRVVAALALAVSPLLTSCASGKNAVTTREFSVHDGVDASLGSLRIRNAVIPTPAGGNYDPGTSFSVAFVVVNVGNQADTLTGASVPANIGTASIASGSSGTRDSIPGGQAVAFTPTTTHVQVTDLHTGLSAAAQVPVTLQFATAGSITLQVPVATIGDPGYATPSPSVSGQPVPTPSTTPEPTFSSTPSPTPSS